MDVTCELSPLVFSELYRLLPIDPARREPLEERLEVIGLDWDWLDEARATYEAKWQDELKNLTDGTTTELLQLSAEHALLASWLMSPLRAVGSCHDLSAELDQAVLTRAIDELPDVIDAQSKSALSPSLTSWVLGMVIGKVDRTLPVVPALLPADPYVSAAYMGLVEHVVHLGEVESPWTEILGTSTLWRGTGIAEGLRPNTNGPNQCIFALIAEAKHLVPEHLIKQLIQHFNGFVDNRDVLSHIAVAQRGGPTFLDAREVARTWQDIRLTLVGITQFVCQQVSSELLDGAAMRSVRPGMWEDRLRWEIGVYI